MSFKKISLPTTPLNSRHRAEFRPTPVSGTLSARDLKRIVAEMVG